MPRNAKNITSINKNKKGFTLIEMVVVLAMVGIMAAVLIPSLITWLNSGENRDRTRKAETIYYAAQAELTRLNSVHQLEQFNIDSQVYGAAPYAVNPADPFGKELLVDANRNAMVQMGLLDYADTTGFNTAHSNGTDDIAFIRIPRTTELGGVARTANPVYRLLQNILVDGHLLDQAILIEYHTRTGNVVSVFYSERINGTGGVGFGYYGDLDREDNVCPRAGDDARPYSNATAYARRQGYFGTGPDGLVIPPPNVLKIYDGSGKPLHIGGGKTIKNVLYVEGYYNLSNGSTIDLSLLDANQNPVKDKNGNNIQAQLTLTRADSFSGALTSIQTSGNGAYNPAIFEGDKVDINNIPVNLCPGGNDIKLYSHRVVWILDYVNGNMTINFDNAGNKGGRSFSVLERYGPNVTNTALIDQGVRVNAKSGAGVNDTTEDTADLYFSRATGLNFNIGSARHLYNIRRFQDRANGYAGLKFTQTDDVDLNDIIFPPITSSAVNGFNGEYTAKTDGGMKIIRNLSTNGKGADGSDIDEIGLFSTIAAGGKIDGLFLAFSKPVVYGPIVSANANTNDRWYVKGSSVAWIGTVAGTNYGTIQDVTVLSDSIHPVVATNSNGTSSRLGGIVGRNDSTGAIKRVMYLAVAPKIGTDKIAPITAEPNGTIDNDRYLSGIDVKWPRQEYFTSGYNCDVVATHGEPYGTERFCENMGSYWTGEGWKEYSFPLGSLGMSMRLSTEDTANYPYMFHRTDSTDVPANIKGDSNKRPRLVWPVVAEEKPQNLLVYYEQYPGSTGPEYGFYYYDKYGVLQDSLVDDRPIQETGYGIFSSIPLYIAIGDKTDNTAIKKVINDPENKDSNGDVRPIIDSKDVKPNGVETVEPTLMENYGVVVISSTNASYPFNYFSGIKNSVSEFTQDEITNGDGYARDYETNTNKSVRYRYPACQAKAISYSEDGNTYKILPEERTYFIGGFAKAIVKREFALGKEAVNVNYGNKNLPFTIRTPQQLLNVNGLACYGYYCKQELDLDFSALPVLEPRRTTDLKQGIYNYAGDPNVPTDKVGTLRRCVIGDDESTAGSAIIFNYEGFVLDESGKRVNKKITNLNIWNKNTNSNGNPGNAALINRYQGAIIDGIILASPAINGNGYSGAIVATVSGGSSLSEIKNCQVTGTAQIKGGECAGGIVGEAVSGSLNVSGCFVGGSYQTGSNGGHIEIGASKYVGGIIGYIKDIFVRLQRVSVFDDTRIETTNAASGYAGGFVGYLNCTSSTSKKLSIEDALLCIKKETSSGYSTSIKAGHVGGDIGGQSSNATEIKKSLILAYLAKDIPADQSIWPIRGERKGNCYFLSSKEFNDLSLIPNTPIKESAQDTLYLTAMNIGSGEWSSWQYESSTGYPYPNIKDFLIPTTYYEEWSAVLAYFERYPDINGQPDYGISYKDRYNNTINETLSSTKQILETGYAIYYSLAAGQTMDVIATNSKGTLDTGMPDTYTGEPKYTNYRNITMKKVPNIPWRGGNLTIFTSISSTPSDDYFSATGFTEHNTYSYVRMNPRVNQTSDANPPFEQLAEEGLFNNIGRNEYRIRGMQVPITSLYEITARLSGTSGPNKLTDYTYCNFAFSESQNKKQLLDPDDPKDILYVRAPAQFINIRTASDGGAILDSVTGEYKSITIMQDRNLDFAEVSMYSIGGAIGAGGTGTAKIGLRSDIGYDDSSTNPEKYNYFDPDSSNSFAYMFRKGANYSFRGIYNGNNYKMLNINIDDSSSRKNFSAIVSTGGLFDQLAEPGRVENVVVVNPRITGKGLMNCATGGIVGRMYEGTRIDNCSVVFSKYYSNYPGYIRAGKTSAGETTPATGTIGIGGIVGTIENYEGVAEISNVVVTSDDEVRSPIFGMSSEYTCGGIVGFKANVYNGSTPNLKLENALYIACAPILGPSTTQISPICATAYSSDLSESCYYLHNSADHGLNAFNNEALAGNNSSAKKLNTLGFRKLDLSDAADADNPWRNTTGCDYPVLSSLTGGPGENNPINLDWLFVPITNSNFTIAYYEQYSTSYGFYYRDADNHLENSLNDSEDIVSSGYCFVNNNYCYVNDTTIGDAAFEYNIGGLDDVPYPEGGNMITLLSSDFTAGTTASSVIRQVVCTDGTTMDYIKINYTAAPISGVVGRYDRGLVPITILPSYKELSGNASIPEDFECLPANRYSSAVSKFGKAISVKSTSIVPEMPIFRGCDPKEGEDRGVILHIRKPEHITQGIYAALTPDGNSNAPTQGKIFKQDKNLDDINYSAGSNFGNPSSTYKPFMGYYNGNGKTMQINHSLFPRIIDAKIENLTINNSSDITCNYNGGVIAAFAQNSEINKCTVKESTMNIAFASNSSDLRGGSAGVIAGEVRGGTITDCTVDEVKIEISTIAGASGNRDSVGGIAGYVTEYVTKSGNIASRIEGCKIDKLTTDSDYKGDILYVGGIAGSLENSSITQCAIYDSRIYDYENGFSKDSQDPDYRIRGLRVGGVTAESAGTNNIKDIIIIDGENENDNLIRTKILTESDEENEKDRYFGGVVGIVHNDGIASNSTNIENVVYLAKAPYSFTELGVAQYPIVAESPFYSKDETNVYFLKSKTYNQYTYVYTQTGVEWSGIGIDTLQFNDIGEFSQTGIGEGAWAKWKRDVPSNSPYPRLAKFALPNYDMPVTYEPYLVYYEKYEDGRYGYYAVKNSTDETDVDIDIFGSVIDYGYMITSGEKISDPAFGSRFVDRPAEKIGNIEGVVLELMNPNDANTSGYIKIMDSISMDGNRYYNPNFAKAMSRDEQNTSSNKEFTLRCAQQVKNISNVIADPKHSEYAFKMDKDIDFSDQFAGNLDKVSGEYIFDGVSYIVDGNFKGKFYGDSRGIVREIKNAQRTLFKNLSGGTIENVKISNANINGSSDVGAIVGVMTSGIIKNINISDSTITSTDANLGGIVGTQENGTISYVDIRDSHIEQNGSADYVGGIVGLQKEGTTAGDYRECRIEVIKVNDLVIKGNENVGGIVGSAESVVKTCMTRNSEVHGTGNVGGIAGETTVSGEVSICAADNTIVDGGTYNDIGGIAGINRGKISDVYFVYKDKNDPTYCPVIGSSAVGGIVGSATDGAEIGNALYLAIAPQVTDGVDIFINPISSVNTNAVFTETYYLAGVENGFDYNLLQLKAGASGTGKITDALSLTGTDTEPAIFIDPALSNNNWTNAGDYPYPILRNPLNREVFPEPDDDNYPTTVAAPPPLAEHVLADLDTNALNALVYTEEYEDGSFGYKYTDKNGVPIDTLDAEKQITDAGYGIISDCEMKVSVGGTLLNDGEMIKLVQKGELCVVPLPDEVSDISGKLLRIETGKEQEGELSVLPNANTSYLPYFANTMGDDEAVFGTESNPYIIKTEKQMLNISKIEVKPDTQFILYNDLDFSAMDKLDASVVNVEFNGIFNGNNKVIKGLNIDSDQDNIGLFSIVNEKGIIENLMIRDASIKGINNVGAFVGKLFGTVRNCIAINANVIGKEENVGTIAGYANEATVENVFVGSDAKIVPVEGTNNVGGIIGNDQSNSSVVKQAIYSAVAPSIDARISPIIGNDNYEGGGLYTDCLYLMDEDINDADIGNMEAKGGTKEELISIVTVNFKSWLDKLDENWIDEGAQESLLSASQSIFSTLFSMLF